jgi:hypothetical protein
LDALDKGLGGITGLGPATDPVIHLVWVDLHDNFVFLALGLGMVGRKDFNVITVTTSERFRNDEAENRLVPGTGALEAKTECHRNFAER